MAEGEPLFEARALLRTFVNSDWKSCHVLTDRLTLFASRDPAIRAAQAGASPSARPASIAEAELNAPHLCTLVALAAPGTILAAGDVFGRVAVLDEERDLLAEQAGTIAWHHHQAGALVEYGQPLLSLSTGTIA